jgi:curved DNA-binding protein CbpA
MTIPNYYEFLQISRNAEPATIHRVYQYLAARFHPDNTQTGDVERFMLLKQAYEVLSNPERRAQYDAASEENVHDQPPLSDEIDFMDSLKGELNRRLALLALLYTRRRTNPSHPEVALAEIEKRMGFPRDYLEFTLWYLQKKGYITRADNSDSALTAEGVDFVETQREQVPVLNKLLTSEASPSVANPETAEKKPAPPATSVIKPPEVASAPENWINRNDACTGAPDPHTHKRERHIISTPDPHENRRERRVDAPDLREDGIERRAIQSRTIPE